MKCRDNSFGRAPQPRDNAPQDVQVQAKGSTSFANEGIVDKPTDMFFLGFPSAQESSFGAPIPQGHAQGPQSDAPSFNVQLQGMTGDALMPCGITGQTDHLVSVNARNIMSYYIYYVIFSS